MPQHVHNTITDGVWKAESIRFRRLLEVSSQLAPPHFQLVPLLDQLTPLSKSTPRILLPPSKSTHPILKVNLPPLNYKCSKLVAQLTGSG